MVHGYADVVRSNRVVRVSAADIAALAAEAAEGVVVDVGAGDGRFVLRRARAEPGRLFVAMDANASRFREASRRASRKAERGGAPNALYVRASAAELPGPLAGLADEVIVNFPWGTLLRAIVDPDPDVLGRLSAIGREEAAFVCRINASAIGRSTDIARLAAAWESCGLRWESAHWTVAGGDTAWGRRLAAGGPWLEATARVRSGPLGSARRLSDGVVDGQAPAGLDRFDEVGLAERVAQHGRRAVDGGLA